MEIRQLRASDKMGFLELVSEYGKIKCSDFEFARFVNKRPRNIVTFVGIIMDEIVATHTIILEEKFIHNFGVVAHFEDLIVHPDYRNNGLAAQMLENSMKFAKEIGCYKAIWSCDKELVKYYKKHLKGYKHEVSMRTDFT